MSKRPSLQAISVTTPLSGTFEGHEDAILKSVASGISDTWQLVEGDIIPVGRLIDEPLPLPADLSIWDSRINRMLDGLLRPLREEIDRLKDRWGAHRLGIVIGTTTSGIADNEAAYAVRKASGAWPDDFRYARQELGDPAQFLAMRAGITGPCYVVSTACSSGAKALISAARLLQANLCDAVLCGGADTLCALTLNGFGALDAMSTRPCIPFSRNRDGISIGEGGALFLMDREEGALRLESWGENCDAYHFSAPDPSGGGAALAIQAALDSAGLDPSAIGYVNLHGTGTKLNDEMEAGVMHRVLGADIPCSSTKGMTGHMLGAAGACEAAFVAMALLHGRLPPHLWDGDVDPELPRINLVEQAGQPSEARHMLTCSYAFGGNNCALILARE
ncbi:MAG: beta-ketoacyl-ACP synthase [Pseudomonadota bacterium]